MKFILKHKLRRDYFGVYTLNSLKENDKKRSNKLCIRIIVT